MQDETGSGSVSFDLTPTLPGFTPVIWEGLIPSPTPPSGVPCWLLDPCLTYVHLGYWSEVEGSFFYLSESPGVYDSIQGHWRWDLSSDNHEENKIYPHAYMLIHPPFSGIRPGA